MTPELPEREQTAPAETREYSERAGLQVAGLVLLCMVLPAVEPAVLIALPYLLFVLILPSRRWPALALAGVAALAVFTGGRSSGLWYIDRGWALLVGGWFVALTLRWPASRFIDRALGAMAGAMAVIALIFALRPGSWSKLDWLVGERLRESVASAVETMSYLRGSEGGRSDGMALALYQAADLQTLVFPALTALATVAGLGVAWWLYVRLAHGDRSGLGPVREFRFNDQLVWLLVFGLTVLSVEIAMGIGDAWSRAGSNTVVFMGALYALRGAAVVLFFNGGVSILGFVVFLVGLVIVAPVVVGGALVIGLGDTWLDLRERARQLTAG